MSNLVQELRSVEKSKLDEVSDCSLPKTLGLDCACFKTCKECIRSSVKLIADRIEAEYDPKPEPDTVEKVALDMLDTFVKSAEACEEENVSIFIDHECLDRYRKRLKALGVKIDDQ